MSGVIDKFTKQSGTAATIEQAKRDREAVVAELDARIARHEWFTAARIIRSLVSGEADEALDLPLHACGVSSLALTAVDPTTLTAMTDDDIIERFLKVGDYRIVAEDGEVESEVKTEADFDEDDDLVSEELAEIYAKQGLNSEAIEIYRKLSLLNPKKSAYFADQIEKLSNL